MISVSHNTILQDNLDVYSDINIMLNHILGYENLLLKFYSYMFERIYAYFMKTKFKLEVSADMSQKNMSMVNKQ